MNRWQSLYRQTQLGLGGEYIPDWPSAPVSPYSLRTPPPATPALDRNMTGEEAQAAALVKLLEPPAIAVRHAAERNGGALAGAAVNPVGQVSTVRPASSEQPSAGQPFNFSNVASVVLPALGATVTVVTFQVPRRKNGVIEFVANQFIGGGWTEGTGDLVWRITADGIPIQGWDNIIFSLGTTSNPGWLGTRPIRVYENMVIALTLTNVGIVVPAGQPLLGLFRGGFYPIEQEGQNQTWL